MKNIIQKLGSIFPSRALILLILKLIQYIYGFLSRLRTGALFPHASSKDCYINLSAYIKYPDRIKIGYGLRVGPGCIIGAMGGIDLGDYVRLSQGVIIETGGLDITGEPPYTHAAKAIVIESGVWIGNNAIILGGVTIGRNAVIGAGAVVTKDVPENSIYAGNPARFIRKRCG